MTLEIKYICFQSGKPRIQCMAFVRMVVYILSAVGSRQVIMPMRGEGI